MQQRCYYPIIGMLLFDVENNFYSDKDWQLQPHIIGMLLFDLSSFILGRLEINKVAASYHRHVALRLDEMWSFVKKGKGCSLISSACCSLTKY